MKVSDINFTNTFPLWAAFYALWNMDILWRSQGTSKLVSTQIISFSQRDGRTCHGDGYRAKDILKEDGDGYITKDLMKEFITIGQSADSWLPGSNDCHDLGYLSHLLLSCYMSFTSGRGVELAEIPQHFYS